MLIKGMTRLYSMKDTYIKLKPELETSNNELSQSTNAQNIFKI